MGWGGMDMGEEWWLLRKSVRIVGGRGEMWASFRFHEMNIDVCHRIRAYMVEWNRITNDDTEPTMLDISKLE